MRLSSNTVNTLLVASAAMLSACTNITSLQPTIPSGSSFKRVTAIGATENVLYRFGTQPSDGVYPTSGLTYVNGTMYGVTSGGLEHGQGVLYSMTPSGTYTILHKFTKAQAKQPLRGLTAVGSSRAKLYGTAYMGGAYDYGTVFKSAPTGRVVVIHSFPSPFPSGKDGAWPWSSLVNFNGTLYGTTWGGGTTDSGTVFSITPSGTEAVVYNFAGGKNDGDEPEAGLINVSGTLYGTTWGGGAANLGVVFKVTRSGTESVLHSFAGGTTDGAHPEAALANVKGTLYGTTIGGGVGCVPLGGCGIIFRVAASGKESVVHKFPQAHQTMAKVPLQAC